MITSRAAIPSIEMHLTSHYFQFHPISCLSILEPTDGVSLACRNWCIMPFTDLLEFNSTVYCCAFWLCLLLDSIRRGFWYVAHLGLPMFINN